MAVSDLEFVERLKLLSARAGLSQAEIARRMGTVTQVAVCHWFAGRRKPTHDNLVLYVEVCGGDMALFYGPLEALRLPAAA
jgi:transcriptional regulator with XRE-family HTH domain